jgi:hypothetical protein
MLETWQLRRTGIACINPYDLPIPSPAVVADVRACLSTQACVKVHCSTEPIRPLTCVYISVAVLYQDLAWKGPERMQLQHHMPQSTLL